MEAQVYTSKTLDHLGLVAGMCREIGISEVIDTHCPSDSPDQIVSTGKDSESFREVIRTFGKELHTEAGLLTIVADSKLYSEQTIQELASAQLNWISRVPGTLQASAELIAKTKANELKPLESEGYSSACYTYEYGGVYQHWVVYHSQSAAKREEATLKKNLDKEQAQAEKALKKLGRQHFHCRQDADQAVQQWQQQWKWHTLTNIKIHEHKKYGQAGKPTPGAPATLSYTIEAQLQVEQDNYDAEVFKRSMFILATNQQVNGAAEEEQLLRVYKEQHSVERGFRFIKDPNVVASSFFVQKPERVAALAFVMTSCLLVYTALEYRIRKALEKENKTIPDLKNKPTQKPTNRWVFQLFVGIHLLILSDGKKITLNLNTEHRDILSLLIILGFLFLIF